MRRTDRLFEILQLFRKGKTLLGREIAEQLEVSVRTVYRDIETLVASGIPIEGERGVGYMLRAPIFLPPLTLSLEEMRALHLGVELLQQLSVTELSKAAESLRGKIHAAVPADLTSDRHYKDVSVYVSEALVAGKFLSEVQSAVRNKQLLEISYKRLDGTQSDRCIRPLQTEFWGRVWTCVAWCELRNGFRVFRIDRIHSCITTSRRFSSEPGKRYKDYLNGLSLT